MEGSIFSSCGLIEAIFDLLFEEMIRDSLLLIPFRRLFGLGTIHGEAVVINELYKLTGVFP